MTSVNFCALNHQVGADNKGWKLIIETEDSRNDGRNLKKCKRKMHGCSGCFNNLEVLEIATEPTFNKIWISCHVATPTGLVKSKAVKPCA